MTTSAPRGETGKPDAPAKGFEDSLSRLGQPEG